MCQPSWSPSTPCRCVLLACVINKTKSLVQSVYMSEHRNFCSGSPAVYQDWSSSHVLWLARKEAIVGSANMVGNLLSPLSFQNKDPSTASQTSLAGFRLHQWSRILCAWPDHTQCLELFTTKANEVAPSDVNLIDVLFRISHSHSQWFCYLCVVHLWCIKIPWKDAR